MGLSNASYRVGDTEYRDRCLSVSQREALDRAISKDHHNSRLIVKCVIIDLAGEGLRRSIRLSAEAGRPSPHSAKDRLG